MSTATVEQTRSVPPPRDGRATTRAGSGTTTTPRPAPAPSRPFGPAAAPTGSRGATTATPEAAAGIAPFVLLTMVLLASGLVATLWLSTAAAADSYRLEEARQQARDLSEQSERLHREVENARSAPALAAAARAEGMMPAGDPAVLLVAPDGGTRLVGEPEAVRPAPGPARPAPRVPAAAPAAPTAPTAPAAPAAPAEDRLQAVPATGAADAGRAPVDAG